MDFLNRGFPDNPPLIYWYFLFKYTGLSIVVFEITRASIFSFIEVFIISVIVENFSSGEIFKKIGLWLPALEIPSLVAFITSLNKFLSCMFLKPVVLGIEILIVM